MVAEAEPWNVQLMVLPLLSQRPSEAVSVALRNTPCVPVLMLGGMNWPLTAVAAELISKKVNQKQASFAIVLTQCFAPSPLLETLDAAAASTHCKIVGTMVNRAGKGHMQYTQFRG
jgi:hypothetical protein